MVDLKQVDDFKVVDLKRVVWLTYQVGVVDGLAEANEEVEDVRVVVQERPG